MPMKNPFARGLSAQLQMAPDPSRSIYVQQLMARTLQNNGRGSRSPAESLDIAASPIIAALLGRMDQKQQMQQQAQQKQMANQLLGQTMRKNIELENLSGEKSDTFSVPAQGPTDPTRQALAGILAQNPQMMGAMAMQQAMPPQPKPPDPYTLSPGQVRYGPNGQPIASVPEAPKAPEGFTLGDGQTRFGPDGKPIASVQPKPEKPPNPPAGYQWNADGSLAFVPGGPADPANRQPNEVQQKNKELVDSLGDADQRIREYEKKGVTDTSSKLNAVLGTTPVTAIMQGEDYRKYQSAGLQWAANLLYLKSGATANPAEIQNTWREYFPQPGDSQGVKDAKAAARKAEVQNARGKFGVSAGASVGWSITPVQ